ncbi:cobalt transporter CbiM [Thermosulfuriphilus sp.]
MHISDGILPVPILVGGGLAALAGVAVGLKRLEPEKIPQTALFTAALFIASLIHIPLGPTSVHLVLNGLAGLILGWIIFPAFLVALLLQAVLFQFGGLTTLGINTLNMAGGGIVAYYLFGLLVRQGNGRLAQIGASLAAALGIAVTGMMVALELAAGGEAFYPAARLVLVAHLPVMVIEGIVSAVLVGFIKRAKPEILESLTVARARRVR